MSIKPCPFCGEIPYLEKIPLHGYGGCYYYEIRCHNIECGCSVKLGQNDTVYSEDKIAKQNAINAWNRRA